MPWSGQKRSGSQQLRLKPATNRWSIPLRLSKDRKMNQRQRDLFLRYCPWKAGRFSKSMDLKRAALNIEGLYGQFSSLFDEAFAAGCCCCDDICNYRRHCGRLFSGPKELLWKGSAGCPLHSAPCPSSNRYRVLSDHSLWKEWFHRQIF